MAPNKDFSQYRNSLFRHLDGIVTAPSAYELHSKGVTDYLLEKKKVALIEITKKFKANEGYLNVALHTLCSHCLLYTSPSPRDLSTSRMPSSA